MVSRSLTHNLILSLTLCAAGFINGNPLRAASGQLDLSPQLVPFELEGVKMSQLAFANGANPRVLYQPPADWKYSGASDSFSLLPASVAQAKATVTKWPTPLSFDPETCKQLTERVVQMLPEGSEKVKVESETLSPLQIDGKPTYLVEASYVFYGEKYSCYCLLLDRKPEPLCFRLLCRSTDYAKLRDTFQRSLYSWQNL